MEFEVHVDQEAVRRYRRWTLVFLLAFPLIFAGSLSRPVLTARLGGEAGEWCAKAMILTGIVMIVSSILWGSWDVIYYRCPRCRRKLPKVHPQGVAEPNIHYACEDCRIIWDLGWACHSGGEGGGG